MFISSFPQQPKTDGIHPRVLEKKTLKCELDDPLTKICNLKSASIPKNRKVANATLICKKRLQKRSGKLQDGQSNVVTDK